MANSKRKCKYCKRPTREYIVVNMSAFCTFEEAVKYANENKSKGAAIVKKADDKKHTKRKRELNDNDKKIRGPAAQKAFNAFIRARDKSLDCISCKRTNEQVGDTDGWKVGGAWDCGHYLTRGAFPELKFEELNAHKQCKSCNGGSDKYAKKTQLVKDGYRENLVDKIGLDKVEWLEGPHEPKKYTCAELKEIELRYKQKLKDLI